MHSEFTHNNSHIPLLIIFSFFSPCLLSPVLNINNSRSRSHPLFFNTCLQPHNTCNHNHFQNWFYHNKRQHHPAISERASQCCGRRLCIQALDTATAQQYPTAHGTFYWQFPKAAGIFYSHKYADSDFLGRAASVHRRSSCMGSCESWEVQLHDIALAGSITYLDDQDSWN
jgi:hypothetical protein